MNTLTVKTLIVDGYNVLRSGYRYAALVSDVPDHTSDTFNQAREALLADVATFAQGSYHATVVFDGAGNPFSAGEVKSVAGVDVIFSPAGVTADSVIEGLARTATVQGAEVVVVTSDASTQWTVLKGRVTRMSAAGFCDEMRDLSEELNSCAELAQPKNTLAARLDASTRVALERWIREK